MYIAYYCLYFQYYFYQSADHILPFPNTDSRIVPSVWLKERTNLFKLVLKPVCQSRFPNFLRSLITSPNLFSKNWFEPGKFICIGGLVPHFPCTNQTGYTEKNGHFKKTWCYTQECSSYLFVLFKIFLGQSQMVNIVSHICYSILLIKTIF